MLTNIFNYFDHDIVFKEISTAWHPYKPLIILEDLKIIELTSKEQKLYMSKVRLKFNLLNLFLLKPIENLSVIGGYIEISDNQKSSLFNDPLNSLSYLKSLDLRNISLSSKQVNSEVYLERIYANFSSPSDSRFYASIKDNTQLGNLTISLESQFNQRISDSFIGQIEITELDFNDPLIEALCPACSNLGKAEGLIRMSYLNKKLVSLFGQIDLNSPSFLSDEGKLTVNVGLNNSITSPSFFIQSSYALEEKKYPLPNILLSLANEKLKIDIPKLKLSDPFFKLQIEKILPDFITKFSLSGDIQNFAGVFDEKGGYQFSYFFRNINLEDKQKKNSFFGLEGKAISSYNGKHLLRVDTPSLAINLEQFFDKKLILNSLKGDFYLTSSKRMFEIINKSFGFYSGDSTFEGKISFLPSSMYTLGDVILSLRTKDVAADKILNFVPNLFSTRYLKSWIDNNIYCGDLDSASLIYRGPVDYKFTDTSSSFQMDFNLQDACLALGSNTMEEIELLGEVDNTNFKGKIIKGNIFSSQIISDLEISRDANKAFNLFVEGESQGPVHSIVDLYNSYNASFITKPPSGSHATEFSFRAPLSNSISLLRESNLLKVRTEITDASFSLLDNNFLIKNFYSTLDFDSSEGFEKSSLSFNLNSIPLEFDLSTKEIKKEVRTLISSESQIKLSHLLSFHDYSNLFDGSSKFNIQFILPGYIRGKNISNSQINIDSQLKGTRIQLPKPFRKDYESEISLKLNLSKRAEKNNLVFSYGDILRGRLILRDSRFEGYVIAGPEKQSINVVPDQIKLVGNFKELDLTNLSLLKINSNSITASPFYIEDLNIGQTKLSSALILDTKIDMVPTSKGPLFFIRNKDFSGTVLLKENQAIDLKLDFLQFNLDQTQEDSFFLSIFNSINGSVLFSVDDLLLGSKSYGNWSFNASRSNNSMILENINGEYGRWGVAKNQDNQESKLVISKNSFGWDSLLKTRVYSGSPEKAFSQIGLDIDFLIGDIEFYPNIKWNGLPWEFEFDRIVGEVGLIVNDITIKNKDTDIKTPNNLLRLISIFNVTDTFEKVTSLDFRKLYRSGFRADTVKGNLYLDSKILKTLDPLVFKSGSSEFRWNGSVTKDKSNKFNTLDLEVIMTLPLREYLPAYALILGGPLTAGIVYIAGKAFERNLDKLSSGKWIISGTLEEPKTNFKGWFED